MYLEQMNSPEDLKRLSMEEMNVLAGEIRQTLLDKLSSQGGHAGPNLGMVEMTIALHYVFQSPKDKIVFDISHQSYTHKMLTGRKEAFLNPEKYGDVTGFSAPSESEHDFFTIGHTSTSVSLACGLAKARDLKNETYNVIALIGDGSLSGGEAYEGLNHVIEEGSNMIVIVNDNEMSIAENHGGLYQNLRFLRETNGEGECNFFKALGFEYYYLEDGHDILQLVGTLQKVKDTKHPVLLHIHTTKGKGYAPAKQNKEQWHYHAPFDLMTGESSNPQNQQENYASMTADYLLKAMKADPTIAAITSGTPTVFGFTQEKRQQAGKQFIDVGIAEEHAVAMASGIAANGGKPVYGVSASFLQRAYDQLFQDLCINNNPAVLLVFAASVYGMKDVTHLGIFDIAMLGNIPNMVYLAPATKEEYMAMLAWGIHQSNHPVAIRVPAAGVVSSGEVDTTDYSILNRYEVKRQGSKVVIFGLGDFYPIGEQVADALSAEAKIQATVINPKFITGLDETLLESLKKEHDLVITIEDGMLEGGFGEKIASFYGTCDMKVKNYGIRKSFPDRYQVDKLLEEHGITVKQIVADLKSML